MPNLQHRSLLHGVLRSAAVVGAASMLSFCGLIGCADHKPEMPDRRGEGIRQPTAHPPAPAVQTEPAPQSDEGAPSTPHAVTGVPSNSSAPSTHLSPGWNRAELVEGTRAFVDAIDSGREQQFWGSLSKRSARMIDQGRLGTRDRIWAAARATLGDIEERKITVIGGSRDSVALRIDGRRMIDGRREDDPIIIHLLREGRGWKIMYPGLLYPEHDLRKGR